MVTFSNSNDLNLCFFNCVMQVMISLYEGNNSRFRPVIQKLKRANPDRIVDPQILLKFFENWSSKFELGEAHDFHEALFFILDALNDDSFEGRILENVLTFEEENKIVRSNAINVYSTIDIIPNETFIKSINDFLDVTRIELDGKYLLKFESIVDFPKNLLILIHQGYTQKPKNIDYPSFFKANEIETCSHSHTYYLKCIVIHKLYHYFVYIFENESWVLYNDESREVVSDDVNWRPRFTPYCLIYSTRK